MSSQGVWTGRHGSPGPAGGGWTTRPRYAPADFATLLWRERRLMLAVFVVLFLLGLGFALTLKTSYSASSSLLVRLGQEYVYEPRIGDAGRGAVPNSDQVVQSEVEILNSAELRQRVIQRLGLSRIDPKLARAYARAPADKKREVMDGAVAAMGQALKVESAPDNTVIRVTYQSADPEAAALVLNTLLDNYLQYRKTVLLNGAQPVTEEQRQLFEQRLNGADAALQAFLTTNGIGDFDAQKSSLNGLQTSLTDESYRVQARLQEIAGRLGELDRQAARVSPEIGLYHDSNPASSDKLLTLKLERQDLLGRYKPSAQPVRDIELRIAALERLIAQGGGQSAGTSRTGLNPVFQTLQTEQIQLNAEAASLRERLSALTAQLVQVTADRLKLASIEPQYAELLRQRDSLAGNLKSLTEKSEEDQAARSIAQKSNDNIRVVERASVPSKGKSLRKPVAILALLFAAFTALCVGVLRIFLRPGLPTPSAAERTFDMPVLATVGLKRR